MQAVGALAFGTQTIAKVDKIVGPGNKWVQAAKKNVAGDYVGIDSIAGPSEVLVIANEQANPAWVAADMLSQAEHGTDSSAVVLTDSQPLAQAILEQLSQAARIAPARRRGAPVAQALQPDHRGREHGRCDSSGRTSSPPSISKSSAEIKAARSPRGSPTPERSSSARYTPVAVGDYWAGPSHTLPTGSRAQFSSALTSNDFVKSISLIEYTADQLAAAADDIIRLAEIEGLDAHARSVQIRRPQ